MNEVFADAHYWDAVSNQSEADYQAAVDAYMSLGRALIHTTDEVLTEFLNFYSNKGPRLRVRAAEFVRTLLAREDIRVRFHSQASFLAALDLYEARRDKGYSLVDCASMNLMRELGLSQVLTRDRHFAQEGFTVLISD
jgi:predicted nucleic acid-binding protein